jgi:hypothetical protein
MPCSRSPAPTAFDRLVERDLPAVQETEPGKVPRSSPPRSPKEAPTPFPDDESTWIEAAERTLIEGGEGPLRERSGPMGADSRERYGIENRKLISAEASHTQLLAITDRVRLSILAAIIGRSTWAEVGRGPMARCRGCGARVMGGPRQSTSDPWAIALPERV